MVWLSLSARGPGTGAGLRTEKCHAVTVVQNWTTEFLVSTGHQKGLFDHQAPDAVRYEEKRPRLLLGIPCHEHTVQQVSSELVEIGVVCELAVSIEQDPGRTGISTDALPHPEMSGLGKVAPNARGQDGLSSELLQGGMCGQPVVETAAKVTVREGVANPCLDRVGARTRHGDDIDSRLIVARTTDVPIDVGEAGLGIPVRGARPAGRGLVGVMPWFRSQLMVFGVDEVVWRVVQPSPSRGRPGGQRFGVYAFGRIVKDICKPRVVQGISEFLGQPPRLVDNPFFHLEIRRCGSAKVHFREISTARGSKATTKLRQIDPTLVRADEEHEGTRSKRGRGDEMYHAQLTATHAIGTGRNFLAHEAGERAAWPTDRLAYYHWTVAHWCHPLRTTLRCGSSCGSIQRQRHHGQVQARQPSAAAVGDQGVRIFLRGGQKMGHLLPHRTQLTVAVICKTLTSCLPVDTVAPSLPSPVFSRSPAAQGVLGCIGWGKVTY